MSTDSRVTAEQLAQALHGRLASRQEALRRAAAWMNEHAPDRCAPILETADLAMEGKISISGSSGEPFFVGNPPAWKELRTHDNHYGSDLNRMGHWQFLLRACLLTGDLKYGMKAAEEAENWIDSCPRPSLPDSRDKQFGDFYSVSGEKVPWHSLNSGIRMFESWRRMLEVLCGTEALPAARVEKIAHSMREQAEAIRAVSPYLFPDAHHNHYLMEMLGVLSYARLFPELPDASAWAEHAAHELERCALAQLAKDGAQVEGCPSYHSGCMYWFSLARQFAADCGFPFADEADTRIRNGIRHAVYATRPYGADVPWGDSHPGVGFIASALWAVIGFEDWEPLAQACRFADPEKMRNASIEQIWDLPDIDAVLAHVSDESFPSSYPAWPRTEWQSELKQVSLRTGWERTAAGVFFACYTPVHYGNHGHIDPAGFEYTARGEPLVIDPGCSAYFESEARRRIKSATSHNTLTVNFREPFDYCSTFAYAPQNEGGIDWVQDDEGLLAAQSTHACYAPATHRRAVALIGNDCLLVLDELTELYWLSSAQLYFQLPFEAVVPRADSVGVVSQVNGVNVAIVPSANLTRPVAPVWYAPDASVGIPQGYTTVRFDDMGDSQQTTRCYATVIVPVETGGVTPTIETPVVEGEAPDWTCRVRIAQKAWSVRWTAERLTCEALTV